MKWKDGKARGNIVDRRPKGRDAVAKPIRRVLYALGEAEVKVGKAVWEKIQPPPRYETHNSKMTRIPQK